MRCLDLVTVLLAAASVQAVGQTSSTRQSPCARCHQAQTLHQAQTPMGRALLPAGENPLFKANPKLAVRKGSFTYTVETHGDNTTYTVSDGSRSVSVPIRWTFGLRMQTWIIEQNGNYYESMVSYYPSINGLETTLGDEKLTPLTLQEALGRALSQTETRQCFSCHSSNAVSHGQLTLNSMQPGVTCEHCHSGTSAHLLDAVQGNFDSAPPSLKKLSSEKISNFCGQCHRSWATVVRTGTHGVANVRFQPYRLANSKCFDGADGRISCIACHDPHNDLVQDASSYDAKCTACHQVKTAGQKNLEASSAKSCPVATAKCTGCHMPKVGINSAAGPLIFTDHTIRRALPGEAYPN
ncbi:MAG TPA: multiheme c-type cytochrome [Candidatus Acidoferrum sp.]|nr:multiheme c-type cytochrome [Candidatus Acidoferrum sp.]